MVFRIGFWTEAPATITEVLWFNVCHRLPDYFVVSASYNDVIELHNALLPLINYYCIHTALQWRFILFYFVSRVFQYFSMLLHFYVVVDSKNYPQSHFIVLLNFWYIMFLILILIIYYYFLISSSSDVIAMIIPVKGYWIKVTSRNYFQKYIYTMNIIQCFQKLL